MSRLAGWVSAEDAQKERSVKAAAQEIIALQRKVTILLAEKDRLEQLLRQNRIDFERRVIK